jgi:serine/threonine-protein kinase
MHLPASSRYRLAALIASGGMGSVYVGFRKGASRQPVAIKRALQDRACDPVVRSTILAEARHASSLRHPNVVSVDDVEEVDGELLLVMDYVEGATLADILASRKPLVPAVAYRIVLDACAALHAIHTASANDGTPLGLVHRDVSPHNVLVGIDGVARLTDFGIAKAASDATFTRRGRRRGKVGYMAPDYIASGKASPASDIFSLGVVLWEALARKRLFDAARPSDAMTCVMSAPIEPPSKLAPAIGPAIDHVVLRALQRSPIARFATASELARALENAAPAIASREEVSAVVEAVAADAILERRRLVLATPDSFRPAPLLPPACAEAAADELAAHELVLSLKNPAIETPPEEIAAAPPKERGLGVILASIVLSLRAMLHV